MKTNERNLFFVMFARSVVPMVVLVVVAAGAAAAQEEVLTVEDAVRMTLENNPRIKASHSEVKVMRSRLLDAKSAFYPQVNFKFIIPFIERESRVSLDQLIWDFGRTLNTVRMSRSNVDASEYEALTEEMDAVLETKVAYYDALAAQHEYESARVVVESKKKELERLQRFHEVGRASLVEVTEASVELGNARLLMLEARNKLESALLHLRETMGVGDGFKFRLKEDLTYKPVYVDRESAVKRALERRPELRRLLAKEAALRARTKASRRRFLPVVVGRAAYRFEGEGATGPDFIAGLGIKMPLFNGFSKLAKVRESRAELERTEHEIEAMKNEIEASIGKLLLDLNYALESINVTEASHRSAQRDLELARKQYEMGRSSEVELLAARALAASTMSDYARAVYNYKIARARLERALGEDIE